MLDDVEIDSDDSGEEESGSWLSRTRSGGKTLSSGFIFLASLFLLFWNESYGKKHADGLDELAGAVRPASMASLDPANEGQPVHLSARVHSQAGARDPFFGVDTDGVAIYRQVEMFQWVEYEETTGRGRKKKTTYHYEMDWDSDYWDSSQFQEPAGHQNPKPALESDGFFAADARFGPYRFDNDRVARQAVRDSWDGEGLASLGNWPQYVEALPGLSGDLQGKRWYQLDSATYYRGNQASDEPELGDLRVSFFILSNDYALTMIGKQEGDRLVDWRASNGDEILLAGGGNLDADTLIKVAEVQHASFTHTLRIVGLIGAVIGAAGVANWLGGFLSMIPVVGSLVSVSLTIAGGLFGLMAGLATIVIGWLAARPWVAALLLIAIGSAVTWAIQKRRKAEAAEKRAKRAASLAAAARERAAQAAQALQGGGPVPAMAGGAGMPPPPPPATGAWSAKLGGSAPAGAAGRGAAAPPPPPPAVEAPTELPPLEWTPGLISSKPPAVKTPTAPPGTPAPVAAPPKAPAPAAPPAIPGFDIVDAHAPPAAPAIPGFDIVDAPTGGSAPAKPAPAMPRPAAAPAIPGFDVVEARKPAAPAAPQAIPGFDMVETRPAAAPAIPGFDMVESNPFAKPAPTAFDNSVRTRPDSLFDTVPVRDEAAPRFDLMPMDDGPGDFPQLALQGALSSPSAPAVPAQPAPVAPPQAAEPAPAAPKAVRVTLGSKGDYQLAKIVRQHADGRQDVVCFELLRGGQSLKRGTQEEVKEALRRALSGQG